MVTIKIKYIYVQFYSGDVTAPTNLFLFTFDIYISFFRIICEELLWLSLIDNKYYR